MRKVKFEDVATRVNTREDKDNTSLLYYVGGDHIESRDMVVHNRGLIEGSTIGPMFYYGFKKGDILLVSRNPHLRKAAVVNFDGICSEKTFVIGTKDEKVLLQRYLAVVVQTDSFWDYCEEHKSGGVNFFVNWSTLAKYEFELPDIEEQRIISDRVWAAYEVKESYRKLISATDEMVKSRFIEQFGNPVDVQGFGTSSIGDYCNVISGFPFKSELFNEDKAGMPLIRIRDVVRGYTGTYTTEECEQQFVVREGDLLVGMDGIFVISAWKSEDALLNQRVCKITPKNDLITRSFIVYAVQPVLTSIEEKTNATTVKHISASQISSIRISDIDKSSVLAFDKVVQQADKSKFELKQAIEKIDKVMRAMMQ